MPLTISSIGLATAQGNTAAILSNGPMRSAEPWPWPVNGWCSSFVCRPAIGVDAGLTGVARWRALAQLALQDCFAGEPCRSNIPIFIGSCNGSAGDSTQADWSKAFDSSALLEGTAWAGQHPPVFSSSCNSGMHALYAAAHVLTSGQANEAIVLAADILSRSNQDNFEVLRVLTNSPMRPWQPTSAGFVLGEAAVALRLVRQDARNDATHVTKPVLANELSPHDGLLRVLQAMSGRDFRFLIGQGTGPTANDESELAAFRQLVPGDVPLATPLVHFGHTLGASGLLGIALAGMMQQTSQPLPSLLMPASAASDGRHLNTRNGKEDPAGADLRGDVLVSCRALNGSCAASIVTTAKSTGEHDPDLEPSKSVWRAPVQNGPLMNPVLRWIAAEALKHRPHNPPDVLLVRLEQPLQPPPDAIIAGRLLPSAVLEITPGFVSQLIARCWGFAGPALCVLGNSDGDANWDLASALAESDLVMTQIDVLGTGDKRELRWTN